jgi:hypothetical protein
MVDLRPDLQRMLHKKEDGLLIILMLPHPMMLCM